MGLNGAPKFEVNIEKSKRNRLNQLMEETQSKGDSAGWELLHHIWDHFDTEWREAHATEFEGQDTLTDAQLADRVQYIDSIEPSRIREYINSSIEAIHSHIGTEDEEEQKSLRQKIHKLELLRVKLASA